jgi:hypothetical protein
MATKSIMRTKIIDIAMFKLWLSNVDKLEYDANKFTQLGLTNFAI